MVKRLLIAVIVCEIPLQFDKYWMHEEELSQWGTITGFNISLTTIALFLLYLHWIPTLAHRARTGRKPQLHGNLCLVLYLGISVVSVLWAQDRLVSVFNLFLLFQAFLIFLYFANNLTTQADLLFVAKALLFCLAFQGIAMIAVQFNGDDLVLGPLNMRIDDTTLRSAGTIGSTNTGASYVSLLIPPALAMLAIRLPWSARLYAAAALSCGLIGLVLTRTRGAWIATALACGLFLWLCWLRGWLPTRLAATVAVAALACVLAFQGMIFERFLGDDRGSAQSRVPLASTALMMIQDHPLGVGANNYALLAGKYAARSDLRAEWFYTVHNKYLLVWAETGILGLAAYIGFLLETVFSAWRAWRGRNRVLSTLALALGLAIMAQMLHMVVDIFNSRPQVQALWLVSGIIVALRCLQDQTFSDSDTSPVSSAEHNYLPNWRVGHA